ncbi:MAG: SRPBCC family protein [Alphaproteobacteria bacterium]|nr:SRPBCC family protein [Alphaproteobacteria bacterium]
MWFVLAAWAGSPEVVVNDDHSVHGEMVVPLAPDVVREKLADPVWISQVDGSGTTVTVHEKRGDCLVTDSVSPNIVKTVRYRVERCPSATGYETKLVESNAFTAYAVKWTFTAEGGGTRVSYDLMTETSLIVPQFVIDQQTKKGVLNLLTKLQAELGG